MSQVEFRVYDAAQQQLGLASVARERPALVFFLRNPGCAICRQKLFELKERAADFRAAGVELAAVTMATPFLMEGLEKRYNLGFPMYSNPGGEVYRALGFVETPLSKFDDPEVHRRTELAIQQGFALEDAQGVSVTQLGGLALFAPGETQPRSVHVADPIYAYPEWDAVLAAAQELGSERTA